MHQLPAGKYYGYLRLRNSLSSTYFTFMKKQMNTELAIEDLIAATCGEEASAREKYILREALRGLVRLAKSEQVLEMKSNVDRLTGVAASREARRRAKAIIMAQRLEGAPRFTQKQLEFDQK